MHLGYSRFGQIERGADFLHRHLFVVIQDDDQPFGAGQALGEQVLKVALLRLDERVFAPLVLDDVYFADVLFTLAITVLSA